MSCWRHVFAPLDPRRPGPAALDPRLRLTATMGRGAEPQRWRRKGSVLIVVLITLLVAVTALTHFMDKASDDLLVEVREADARRLRQEAYSALETTLAVLHEFRLVNGVLRSQAEGWGDPLAWAGYEPSAGRKVTVAFEDESGKISLPRATAPSLIDLFKSWELTQTQAEKLTDALLHWMKTDYVPSAGFTPTYELDPYPFEPPGRSLRSWSELAAIDEVRDLFFSADGRPNERWKKFTELVSLLDFPKTNLNSARTGVLAAQGFDLSQQGRMNEYLSGSGSFRYQGPGYFRSVGEAATVLGTNAPPGDFGTEIRALRILVTVEEGRSQFRLNVVVTPAGQGGAKAVTQRATSKKKEASAKAAAAQEKKAAEQSQRQQSTGKPTSRTGQLEGETKKKTLEYPFTILEIRENDAMPTASAEPTPAA